MAMGHIMMLLFVRDSAFLLLPDILAKEEIVFRVPAEVMTTWQVAKQQGDIIV